MCLDWVDGDHEIVAEPGMAKKRGILWVAPTQTAVQSHRPQQQDEPGHHQIDRREPIDRRVASRKMAEGLFTSPNLHGKAIGPLNCVLQDQVVPRLRSAMPTVVHCVGAEDAQELIQDSIAMAAKLMHTVEAKNTQFTPGSIAHEVVRMRRQDIDFWSDEVVPTAYSR